MIKGMFFAFWAAFSWGAAIVMSKKGVENLDAGGLFFWQICSASVLAWVVLFLRRKKLPLTPKAMFAYTTGVFEPFLAYTLTLYGLNFISAGGASIVFLLSQYLFLFYLLLYVQLKLITLNTLYYFLSVRW